MLKQIIPEIKHVNCLCHAMHNSCETIRNDFIITNEIISFLKKV